MVTLPTVRDAGAAIVSAPKSSVDARDITGLGNAQAKVLGNIGDTIEEVAAPYAERAGMARVERDEAGNITVAPSLTIGRLADVERKSAMMTFQAGIRSAMQNELQRLSDQTYRAKEEGGGGGDPEWFAQQSRAYIKALASQQRDGLQPVVMTEGLQIADQFHRGVQSKRYQLDAKQQQGTLRARLDQLDNQIVALSRANYGGEEFNRAIQEYQSTLMQMADDPRFGVSREAVQGQFAGDSARYKAQAIIGDIERSYDPKNNGSFKAAMEKAERILTDPGLSLTEGQRRQYHSLAVSEVRQREGERKALASVLSQEGAQIIKDIEQGVPVSRALIDDFMTRAGDVGAAGAIRGVMEAERKREAYRHFQTMPLAQFANPAKGQGLTVGQSAIRDKVIDEARRQGLPADAVAAIVSQESGFDPAAKNQESSAFGLFQILGDERAKRGIGDSADPDAQIRAGIAKMKENWNAARAALGRDPSPGEFYAVHWQGIGAGPKIISNPDGDFRQTLDTIKPGWADEVIRANPNLSGVKTNRDFVRLAGDLIAKRGGGQSIDLPMVQAGGRPLPASMAKSRAQEAQSAFIANRQNEVLAGQRDVMDDPTVAAIWRNVGRERLQTAIPAMIKAMDAYETPNQEDLNNIAAVAYQVGTPEQKRQVAELAVRADFAQAAQQLPAAEFAALVERKSAEFEARGSMEEKAAIRNVRESYAKLNEEFASDPWGASRKIGLRTPSTQTPLNFENPEFLAAGLKARALDIASVRALRGGEAFGAVMPAEASAMADVLSKGTPEQVAGVFSAMGTLSDDVLFKTLDDPKVKAGIAGALRTTDPVKYSTIMSSLDKIESRDQDRALRVFDKASAERLAVWQSNHRYMDDKTLMEILRRDAQMEPQALERRKAAISAAKQDIYKLDAKEIVKKMDDTFLPWNGPSQYRKNDGDTRHLLQADYAEQYGRFIADGLDEKAAHEQTRKLLSTKWQASPMNGGVLMPNAPEREYKPIDGSHKWLKDDADELVKTAYGQPLPYVIKSDARTMREAGTGVKPSYVLMVVKPNGQAEQAMIDGRPVRWAPDETAAMKKQRDILNAGVGQADRRNAMRNTLRGIVGLPPVAEGGGTPENQRIVGLFNDLQMRKQGLEAATNSFGSAQGGAAQMYRRDIDKITGQLEAEAKKGGYASVEAMIEAIRYKPKGK